MAANGASHLQMEPSYRRRPVSRGGIVGLPDLQFALSTSHEIVFKSEIQRPCTQKPRISTAYFPGDQVSALSRLERYSTNARRPVGVACTHVRGLESCDSFIRTT